MRLPESALYLLLYRTKTWDATSLHESDRLREFPSLDLVEILHDFSFHLEAV
jgi:hypothetical protein